MTDDAPPPSRSSRGYGVVLLVLALSVAAAAIGPRGAGLVFSTSILVALWFAVAHAIDLPRSIRRAGVGVALLLAVGAVVAFAVGGAGLRAAVGFATAATTLAVAALIAGDLVRRRDVTLSTIAGLVSLYLLIALFFSQVYLGAAEISTGAFASSVGELGRFDLLYFSFVTMTTVGYGDITPAVDVTRALAAAEAVTGQLFLVTVVARAVTMMRPPERRQAPPPDSG